MAFDNLQQKIFDRFKKKEKPLKQTAKTVFNSMVENIQKPTISSKIANLVADVLPENSQTKFGQTVRPSIDFLFKEEPVEYRLPFSAKKVQTQLTPAQNILSEVTRTPEDTVIAVGRLIQQIKKEKDLPVPKPLIPRAEEVRAVKPEGTFRPFVDTQYINEIQNKVESGELTKGDAITLQYVDPILSSLDLIGVGGIVKSAGRGVIKNLGGDLTESFVKLGIPTKQTTAQQIVDGVTETNKRLFNEWDIIKRKFKQGENVGFLVEQHKENRKQFLESVIDILKKTDGGKTFKELNQFEQSVKDFFETLTVKDFRDIGKDFDIDAIAKQFSSYKGLPGTRKRPGQAPAFGLSAEEVEDVGKSPFKKQQDDLIKEAKKPTLPVYKGEKDLTTKILKDLEGKTTVSKQYILDATNRPELKQVERDLIRQLVETEGDTINVADFAKKVKAELLPLKVVDKKTQVGYGVRSTRYEGISLPDNIRGRVKNYDERVYESPIKTSAGGTHFNQESTPNYFGHTRIEEMADGKTVRVIEGQTDLYQKGNLERETDQWSVMKGDESVAKIGEKEVAKRLEGRKAEVSKLQQYDNRTSIFRMFREEMKYWASKGKTKLQFPTGETAMKIEGLGDSGTGWGYDNLILKPDDLKVGIEVRRYGEDWIITDVLGDGKFKAVPSREFDTRLEGVEGLTYGEQIDYARHHKPEIFDSTETFDISGKIDTNNPIYKFYEKDVTKYLNKFGGKRVVDENGVSWTEIPITKEMAKAPVEAFGVVAGVETDEEGNITFNPEKALLGAIGVSAIGSLRKTPLTKIVAEESPLVAKPTFTSRLETPVEYALGKRDIARTEILEQAKQIGKEIKKLDITKDDSYKLYNAFEQPDTYVLPEKLKQETETLFSQVRQLNETLGEAKVERGILEDMWDSDTYLMATLEQFDGSKPTAEQLTKLKIATDKPMREQLATSMYLGGGKLSTKVKNIDRKYLNADDRDKALESFGLQTKRDFVNSLRQNVSLTTRVVANYEFNEALRDVAKSGVLPDGTKRTDIVEVYDPKEIKQFKDSVRSETRVMVDDVLNSLRQQKLITEQEYKQLITQERLTTKKSISDVKKIESLDDVDRALIEETIDEQLDSLNSSIESIKRESKELKTTLTEKAKQKISSIREKQIQKVKDYYSEKTLERSKLLDKGFFDAGTIRGAEPLRGIMVTLKDYRAINQLLKELEPNSFEDFARSLKLLQATGDLFQLPETLRASVGLTNIAGAKNWVQTIASTNSMPLKDWVEASEFVNIRRPADIDVDVWNKNWENANKEVSAFITQLEKAGDFADKIPLISNLKTFLKDMGDKLESWQFNVLMAGVKVKTWQAKVSQLQKAFPDKPLRDIQIEVGRAVDDAFGGLNWDKLMARNPRLFSKSMQRALRISFFASDRLTSILRQSRREYGSSFTGGVKGKMAREYVARSLAYGLIFSNLVSLLVSGKTIFENDDKNQWYKIQLPFKDQKGDPYYVDAMGNWGQKLAFINRPVDFLRNKISGPAKIALGFAQKNQYGDSIPEIVVGAVNPLPFSWRNILESAYSEIMGVDNLQGVPEKINQSVLLSALEFSGFAGSFSGGKSKTQSLVKLFTEQGFRPGDIGRWLTGEDMMPKKQYSQDFIEILELRESGNIEEANRKVNEMTEEEWKAYKKERSSWYTSNTTELNQLYETPNNFAETFLSFDEMEQQRQLDLRTEQSRAVEFLTALKSMDKDKAQEIYDIMTDEQYENLRVANETFNQVQDTEIKEGEQKEQKTVSEIVQIAEAFKISPQTAFKILLTRNKIEFIKDGVIKVDRRFGGQEPRERSIKIREQMGADSTVQLDHIVPLQLGGLNNKSNLELVPIDIHKQYTTAGNILRNKVEEGSITLNQAQKLIKQFRDGEIDIVFINNL